MGGEGVRGGGEGKGGGEREWGANGSESEADTGSEVCFSKLHFLACLLISVLRLSGCGEFERRAGTQKDPQ